LALFCELLIIRWLATEVRIFAYFKNLPLMSAFLGLGLGFLWTHSKRDYFKWTPLGLLYFSAILIFALGLGLTYLSFVDPTQYMLFGTQHEHSQSIWPTLKSLAIMLGLFALSTSIFVGLGQRMGKLFEQLKPLEAYSINIAGSLIGSILFSLLSFGSTDPGVWLVVAGILFVLLQRKPAHIAVICLGLLYTLVLAPYIAKANYGSDFVKTVWSPYYRIDMVQYTQPSGPYKGTPLGYNLYINYDTFQSILDCSPETIKRFPPEVQKTMLKSYSMPFESLGRPVENALILGSGSGNDVAAAVRSGVKHIDAVEIDPAIVEIGKRYHPEHPYQSPNVNVHIMDARTFLKNSKKKYDVVVFAALDSHAAFSSLSSLRLDNYIFTRQAFEEANKLLSDHGIISVTFVVIADWLWDRQSKALATATNMMPLGWCYQSKQTNGILLSGPGIVGRDRSSLPVTAPAREVKMDSPIPLSSDDWPFLFLPRRELPVVYMLPIFAILSLAFIPLARTFFGGTKSLLNWQMFGLGMGFMLLEVRAMADLSLLFGSTWIINSVIICGVMIVILAANYLASKLSESAIPWFGLAMVLSLIVTTFVNASDLASLGTIGGGIAGCFMYLFPLVFAASIFALLFKSAKNSTAAFAYNLFGGLIGVVLEYVSMAIGIHALGWVAVAIYGTLLCTMLKRPQSGFVGIIAERSDASADLSR
jgi:hypothetical protein